MTNLAFEVVVSDKRSETNLFQATTPFTSVTPSYTLGGLTVIVEAPLIEAPFVGTVSEPTRPREVLFE